MNDSSNAFLICPECGVSVSVGYPKTLTRPTRLDESRELYCPCCGTLMVCLLDASWDEQWELEEAVRDQIQQRNRTAELYASCNARNQKRQARMAGEL